MSRLVHIRGLFTIPGPKVATIGLDFQAQNDVTAAELALIVGAAASGWNGTSPNMNSTQSASVTWNGASGFLYDVETNPTPPPALHKRITLGPIQVPANNVGGIPGSISPPQVAVVCSFKTDISSRRTRGRVYLPPPIETETDSAGVMTQAYVNSIESGMTAWVGGIQNSVPLAQDLRHVIVSLAGPEVTRVTSYVCKRRVDTQRRRLTRSADVP